MGTESVFPADAMTYSFGIAAVLLGIAGVILLQLGWKVAPEDRKVKNEWDELNQFRQEYSTLFGLACLVVSAVFMGFEFLMLT